jgi:hypothetical protein
MTETNSVVAIYDTHTEAEAAIRALRETNFQMGQLSIIGKDYHTEEHPIGFYNAGDRMKFWGKNGAFWGGLWGWLVGAGFFLIPGVGHIIVLGPLVGWIAGALEGAALGAGVGVLGAALASAARHPEGQRYQVSNGPECGKIRGDGSRNNRRGRACSLDPRSEGDAGCRDVLLGRGEVVAPTNAS